MHYHTLEWSANGRTTVATKDPMLQGVLGGWKRASTLGLSHRDAFLANHIYGCLNEWLAKCGLKRNPCRNDGYLGSSCTCVCPPGTEGRTCGTVRGGYYKHLKSPCSQQVTHPTTLTSPNYPAKYDPDTWCVYRVEAPQCQAPEVTVLDLQLGPRDHRNHCYTDYLEVRNASLYDGFL
ncbi:blastula protease 10-like isoform X2 [Scylla paramamosain]